jgi:hypothetical protein
MPPQQIHVTDRRPLRGLTQFPNRIDPALPQSAEDKPHCGTLVFEGGFCATLFRTAREPLILKRRDAGAVDQARLEIDSVRAC